MGQNITCCSTEEIVKYEDEKPHIPVVYTYPDNYLDDVNNVHRSYSEITKIALQDI
jgi:hypothetical protein